MGVVCLVTRQKRSTSFPGLFPFGEKGKALGTRLRKGVTFKYSLACKGMAGVAFSHD